MLSRDREGPSTDLGARFFILFCLWAWIENRFVSFRAENLYKSTRVLVLIVFLGKENNSRVLEFQFLLFMRTVHVE